VHGPARRAMKQSEIVARQISQQILTEGMTEGARLPPEKAMVEEYQVGRGTLREALRLLENRGVLSIKTGREGGPVVRRPRAADLGESIGLFLQFGGIPTEQVFSAQRALAPRLVRLAAEHVTPPGLAAMGECLDRMELYVDQVRVFQAESERFHSILIEAARSPVLALLVDAVDSVLDGLRDDGPIPDSRHATHAGRVAYTALHRRLHEALGRNDGDAAAAATEQLIDMMSPPGVGAANRRGVRGASRSRRRTSERSA
jgi:DNA-binding FadR family transcriptional regulator